MGHKAAEDLEGLLDELEEARHGPRVSLGDMLDATGRRSFGPLLLVPGLVVLSPLGGVPGMATCVGLLTLLVSVQLLIGRHSFWVPKWLLRRSVSAGRFRRALRVLRKPARWIDRFLRPRLRWVLQRPTLELIVVSCVIVGLVMPFLEVVPFADTAPGAALVAFGLALIAHDGVLALIAEVFCAIALVIAAVALLG